MLLQQADQLNQTIDLGASFNKLEKDETREIRSFDSIAKVLSKDFPELLQFILDEYQVDATESRALIGKEFVLVKRIADVLFEAKDKNGNEVIIHLEFERKYESDEQMDKRKLEYRQLMEMDEELEGKTVLCNVFYFRGSPTDKQAIEERHVKLPTTDPRYSGELKYKAYHLSLVTIDMILNRNLPFLLPFIVESELKAEVSTKVNQIASICQQIDNNEAALTSMIERLTANQLDSLRTTIEYLWGKSYSNDVFNKSTLLALMRERLNLRQDDIQLGRTEGISEGRTEKQAEMETLLKQMAEEGKLAPEQLEEVFTRLEKLNPQQKKA